MNDPPVSDPHLDELAEALGFTQDDLASNRAGFLSSAQLESVCNELRWRHWISLSLLSLVALAYGILGIAQNQSGFLVFTGILMMAALSIAIQLRWQRVQLRTPVVERTSIHSGDTTCLWNAHFSIQDKQWLVVPRNLFAVFRYDQQYSVYFLPQRNQRFRRRILSIEPVPTPRKKKTSSRNPKQEVEG